MDDHSGEGHLNSRTDLGLICDLDLICDPYPLDAEPPSGCRASLWGLVAFDRRVDHGALEAERNTTRRASPKAEQEGREQGVSIDVTAWAWIAMHTIGGVDVKRNEDIAIQERERAHAAAA